MKTDKRLDENAEIDPKYSLRALKNASILATSNSLISSGKGLFSVLLL